MFLEVVYILMYAIDEKKIKASRENILRSSSLGYTIARKQEDL